jgi:hypothetical protein
MSEMVERASIVLVEGAWYFRYGNDPALYGPHGSQKECEAAALAGLEFHASVEWWENR